MTTKARDLAMFTVTLITNPAMILDPALVRTLRDAMGGGDVLWLAPKTAAEFAVRKLPGSMADIRDSLTAAISDIQRLAGTGDWKWGDLHKARFEHQIWGRIPWLGDKMIAISPTGGGDYTISRGSWGGPEDDQFRHRHGAGLRVVYDLADLDASLFSPAVGASGNLFSKFYVSWQADWAAGRTRTIPATPRETSHSLRLEP